LAWMRAGFSHEVGAFIERTQPTSNTLRISLQLLIIIVFCFTCGGCTESLMQNEHSEFMIGKWQATQIGYDIYGNYFEEIFVKFSRYGRLLYCRKRPIESFCSFFDYTFLDENLILVKNRRFKSGERTLSRSGDNLLICFRETLYCEEFTRDNSKFNPLLEVFGILR
jgi:hypothetical protein